MGTANASAPPRLPNPQHRMEECAGGVKYIVPNVTDHLFLQINGEHQSTLSDATAAAPHPLSLGTLIVPATGRVVTGEYVFEIPDHGVASLEMLFIDTDQGDMHAQLFGLKPSAQRSIAAPVNNGLIEAKVLAVRMACGTAGIKPCALDRDGAHSRPDGRASVGGQRAQAGPLEHQLAGRVNHRPHTRHCWLPRPSRLRRRWPCPTRSSRATSPRYPVPPHLP